MKTPEEIKHALKLCGHGCYSGCPYNSFECVEEMSRDALTYIQQIENQLREATKKMEQLEAAQPKWISVKGDWIEIETFDHEEQEWWHEFDTHRADATEFVTHWTPLPEPTKGDD